MDSISRPEFHEIFERVSANIDLKQCTNALAIEQKLKEVRDRSKVKFKTSKTRTRRVEVGRRTEWLDTLMEHDFASRAIFEASRNPRGIIAMTLKYGRPEAQRRILAQRRAALRSRGAFIIVPRRVSRIPEYRRIPTHRRQFKRERF